MTNMNTGPLQKGSPCYTCRTRKVRCEVTDSTQEAEEGMPSKCTNCQRLGFRCRWRAPESGDDYSPPPKRRRTIGQRRQRSQAIGTRASSIGGSPLHEPEANHESSTQSVSQHQTPTNIRDCPPKDIDRGSYQSSSISTNHLTTFGLDLSFETDYLGFDLAGESFDDLFPFATIDSSLLGLGDVTGDYSTSAWQSDTNKLSGLRAESSIQSFGDVSTVINDDNRHLIQHYLEVIKCYSKVDDRVKESNNLFVSAFTQSLTFPPLLYAILSFSASHLSIKNSAYSEEASRFNQLAEETFCQFKQTHAKETASLLSALFVRIKQLHVMGGNIDALFDLMTEAIGIVSTKEGERALADPNSLVRRIVLRLALLDARGTCFRLGGGKLVKTLERIRSLSFIFNFDASNISTPPYGAAISLLRADILRHKVGEIDARLQKQIEAEFVSSAPIRTEEIRSLYENIRRELGRCDRDRPTLMGTQTLGITTNEVLDAAEYNYHIVSSALHSALLYLYQVYPMPSFDINTPISKILQHQLKIQNDPSRANSPPSILPSSIFLAGLSTTDPIYRNWVVKTLKEGDAWGVYIRKTRKLLEAIHKMQAGGQKVDICYAMDQVTGRFLI
ncbi:C6 zinc finger domain-containing protein [Colletotrichum tofieldiae]|uniref:C6 zinc finger domain-containing protein n=1 Tax=Colletotrichum tofieldiae TaxID=708197 RepID=A0A166YTZ2_9PEZI|nr:C6 zinc finger domain-containing protein [Colletotrichum tofieldiae]